MRVRRVEYRCCLAAWIVAFAACAASAFSTTAWIGSSFGMQLSSGLVSMTTATRFFNAPPGMHFEGHPFWLSWGWDFWKYPDGAIDAAVPLWPLLGVLSLPTFILGRQVRRQRVLPGHCLTCGYDLTGNRSGTCSECGAPVSTSSPSKDDS